MKNWLLVLIVLCSSLGLKAQSDTTMPPYKKYPTLPPLQILLGDSTTKFTKKDIPGQKPVLIMLFSPECSHCQHEAEELVAHKGDLGDIQVIMITFHPLWQMNQFVTDYKLKEIPNIVVGKDLYYILPGFYALHNLPFLALYDRKGDLISVFEGSMGIEKLIQTLKEKSPPSRPSR
ncbi:MAG: TlpA family protein disulfide reductase [Flavisolibacter sp.]